MMTYLALVCGIYFGGFLVRLAYLTEDHKDLPSQVRQMRAENPGWFFLAAFMASLAWPRVLFPPKKES